MTSYKVMPIYDEEPQCETLVVHCIDYRVQQGIEQFCAQHLRISGQYNRLAIPGGALQFLLNRQWFTGVIQMYQRLHGVKRLVLVNHMHCSACRDFMLQSNMFKENGSIEECEHDQHIQALQQTRVALSKELDPIQIDLFIYEQMGSIVKVDGRQLFELIAFAKHPDL